MAEGNPGNCPQVFVVDGLSNFISMPRQTKSMWAKVRQKLPLLLLGLTVLGLVLQGFFIYRLYKKTEAFSLYGSQPVPMNQSNPKSSRQQGSNMMGQLGSKEYNEIARPHMEQNQLRPFAHLIGSDNPIGQNNVVLWKHDSGDAITHHMSYDKGRLLVEKEGYYYLYSKVQLNAAAECSLIQHRVMQNTSAYGLSIELMRSKSIRCRTSKPSTAKPSDSQDLWNSFLGGIFHLQSGDKIFVELGDTGRIRPGPADNFMGAFMIFP